MYFLQGSGNNITIYSQLEHPSFLASKPGVYGGRGARREAREGGMLVRRERTFRSMPEVPTKSLKYHLLIQSYTKIVNESKGCKLRRRQKFIPFDWARPSGRLMLKFYSVECLVT